jgi:hypothetical protein
MRDDVQPDPAALLVSVLADEIADRLASRLGAQLAQLVKAGVLDPPSHERPGARHSGESTTSANGAAAHDGGLWSAGRVAEHYGVAVRFIYQHADELCCIRLGGGTRPRLRFDPNTVKERWPNVGSALPDPTQPRCRSTPGRQARRPSGRRRFELIDFDREP